MIRDGTRNGIRGLAPAVETACDGCGALVAPAALYGWIGDPAFADTREKGERRQRMLAEEAGWTVEGGTERVSCPACRERGGRG